MEIKISFEGNKRVAANFPDGLTMMTDQPVDGGGDGSAPSPFAAFLGSIGTCAGIYVLEFCNARGIPADGISLTQQVEFGIDAAGKRRLAKVGLTINLPPEFPEKYRNAVVKTAELCAVKKAVMDPPQFVVEARVA